MNLEQQAISYSRNETMENQSRSFVQGLKKLLLTPANVALALVTLQVLQAAEPFYQFFVKLNFCLLYTS